MKKLISVFLIIILIATMMTTVGCVQNDAPVVTTPLLRIGILSDTHINADTRYSMYDRLEKALMFYKQKGVDGILITGDLQDNRTSAAEAMRAMEEFQDIWLRVFPNNVNDLTGEYVEPMFIYGNHDKSLVEAEYWFDGIGSEYEDAWIKEIKGYQFVGVHYTKENGTLVQKYLSQAQEASTDKPFFFAQHVPVADTIVGGYESYEGNTIPMHDFLKRSNNCVMFTGHTHVPLTDERAIWQSNSKKAAQFTVVTCGTLHYAHLMDFCDLEINGAKHQTQQGMYMVVDGSQVTLERYSFTDMEITYDDTGASLDMSAVKQIGDPWIFDAMQKKDRPYAYADREANAYAPVFPYGATLEVSELTANSATITVPAASVEAPDGFSDLVQSYYAEITDTATGELVATVEVAAPYHIDTVPEHLNQPVTIYLTDLTPGTEYSVCVYARECYQKSSDPISVTVTTLAE